MQCDYRIVKVDENYWVERSVKFFGVFFHLWWSRLNKIPLTEAQAHAMMEWLCEGEFYRYKETINEENNL